MPTEPTKDDSDEARIALETGLERVRLIIVAEEDPAEIRRTWDSLDKDVAEGPVRTKLEAVRIQVDNLTPALETVSETTSST